MRRRLSPRVTVWAEEQKFAKLAAALKRISKKILVHAGKRHGVALYLVRDGDIRRLNRRFRGKNIATTVLSFREPTGFPHPEWGAFGVYPKERFLGEIYLAPERIREKEEDPVFLLVHSMLHLLGYTHEGERDTMKMERQERAILQRIGKKIT